MQDDRRIKDDVIKELDFDPLVDETGVGVSVADGAVTLSGMVPNLPARRRALEAARHVKGVKAVADDLEVRLPGGQDGATDGDIARKIAHVIEWNVSLPDNAIKAIVADGQVRLTGQLHTEAQKKLLEEYVGFVRGVVSIENLVEVEERGEPEAIARSIESALHRRAALDATGIKVAVEGDKVVLTGTVRDAAERRLVEDAVWSSPGVEMLEDRLTVGFSD